jgi:hypothetical protein
MTQVMNFTSGLVRVSSANWAAAYMIRRSLAAYE